MREVQTIAVAEDEAGVRLDRWFRRRWPHLGQGQLHKLIRSGQVRIDGARAKPDSRLPAGAMIRVPPLPDAPVAGERAVVSDRDAAFAKSLVLYEDDEVLVLNKPAGLAVQGGTKTTRHIDGLLGAWGEGLTRPRLVHRLDRDTSGVLVLGKSPQALRAWPAPSPADAPRRPIGPSSPVSRSRGRASSTCRSSSAASATAS